MNSSPYLMSILGMTSCISSAQSRPSNSRQYEATRKECRPHPYPCSWAFFPRSSQHLFFSVPESRSQEQHALVTLCSSISSSLTTESISFLLPSSTTRTFHYDRNQLRKGGRETKSAYFSGGGIANCVENNCRTISLRRLHALELLLSSRTLIAEVPAILPAIGAR